MEQIIITHLNGTTLKLQSKENASTITKASQTVELIGQDVVDISVESAKKLVFSIGDKITIIGREYTLNTAPTERKISETNFLYDLQLEGVQYDMLRAAYSVNVDTTSNQIQDINGDSLTGDMKRFLDVLISNLNRVFPGKWVLGSYPSGTETRTESFNDSDNCLSVLQTLCGEDKYNTEFSISIAGNGVKTLNVGATGTVNTYTFEYGRGKGIYELTRQKVSSSNIITRLNVFGSSKNISTLTYRASKLCLPTKNKAQSFLESASSISKYGVWEATKNFENIYPHRTGTISALGDSQLKFIDSSMDFDLNEKDLDGITTKYLIPGTSAKIHFNTGNLAGYEFEVTTYDNATKQFTLLQFTDENGYTFPSADSAAFKFAAGDKYVILDIYMPQSYINTAETALQTSGQAFLDKYSQPKVSYGLTVDSFFLKNIVGADAESNIIWAGDYIPIKDADLEVDKTIRVKSFTRDLLQDYSYNLTIADISITYSIISRVISDLNGIEKIIRFNDLNDPAKARRNYLAAQEVLNMIFDPEGDFYSEKIKPLSIDTTMLSVGSKSMQFGLVGTILQPNYGGAKNRIVYTGGTLTHYTVLDVNGDPRTWNITDGDVTLPTDGAYYVYAKCARTGTGASLLFTTQQITVESDGAYYHFLIGVVNSVDINNARAVALMYGFTTINGRFIKTGRIMSTDGQTWFDLDAGEFQGVFKFTNGTNIETALNAKAKHFIAEPTTPYTVGDLWTDTNVLLRCKTTRLTGSYSSADWESATTYDNTKTTIDGGLVTSGTLQVAGDTNILAGITGNGIAAGSIRFWAGQTYANRASAPFRVAQDGSVVMTSATVTGTINASAGTIGGFSISSSQLSATSGSDEMILSAGLMRFHESSDNTWVYIGGDVMPISAGGFLACPMRVEVSRTRNPDSGYANAGIYFNITGVTGYDDNAITGNHALYIDNGDICGFRLRTRRIAASTTLSHMDSIILAIPTAGITLTLPAVPKVGQVYFIRRCVIQNIVLAGNGNYITTKDSASKTANLTLTSWSMAILVWDHVNDLWWSAHTASM